MIKNFSPPEAIESKGTTPHPFISPREGFTNGVLRRRQFPPITLVNTRVMADKGKISIGDGTKRWEKGLSSFISRPKVLGLNSTTLPIIRM